MIFWSEEKDRQLRASRGISFERIAAMYREEQYEAVIEHPTRKNQQILVMKIDGYTWAVPFVMEEDGKSVFLKTAYPSRKLHRQYGGEE